MTPLYRRVLGARFAQLPAQVQALHELADDQTWVGTADVERGRNVVCRLAGWITSLPPPGRAQNLQVHFAVRGDTEIWTRRFGTSTFRSVQYARRQDLCERVGPVTFHFETRVTHGALSLHLRGMRVLGIPVPRLVQPAIETQEREIDGRYHFRVESMLPVFGLLVRYAGSLTRAGIDRNA